MIIMSGSSRYVILISKFAFKIPKISMFKCGMEQNIGELKNKNRSNYLAHLYFSLPFGILNIMERLEPLNVNLTNDEGWSYITDYFKSKVSKDELEFLLSDGQCKNFGTRGEEIDYGL